ncbi:Uncharacterized protein dnl_30500 [Desulfonema limicola]|uniref:Uncharacterized protein n=1 Tax=Desulfonema limicola TaxID=45656 RepID=A0A975B8G9_9BACT|nr:Uncharacterized protein dnl_30500 [Desulfonema limicola]
MKTRIETYCQPSNTDKYASHSCTSMKTRIETIAFPGTQYIRHGSQLYFHENKD